uniref:Aromatic-L-amino-acid decarboxylase n=1 Tax=Ditylenchus dipsaci TaxID=166011 RepID=A0A915CSF8_9BILA
MGDILSGGLASIGFTWKSSPSMTELEMAMTDWLARAFGDATLVALLSARARAVSLAKAAEKTSTSTNWLQSSLDKALNKINVSKDAVQKHLKDEVTVFDNHDPSYFTKLVAYCSDQAHSSIDKGVMLAGVRMRKLKSSKDKELGNYSVEPEVLEQAIKEDKAKGLTPFIMIVTVGTTNTCGVDSIKKLGGICTREKIWLHVDAAYAGSFLLCPEFRYLAEDIHLVDSFNLNVHKAMMINFDCSPMWFKDAAEAINYFNVDPVYLKHEHQAVASDYRHLQVALGRRFRALKIWFVLRSMGVSSIQEHLRKQVDQAKHFARLISQQSNFELFVPQHLGLVCFRLKGENEPNEKLNTAINDDGRIHMVPSSSHGVFFLRFAVCSQKTTLEDVEQAVEIIAEISAKL